jgi:signal transduction histidine kinase
LSATPQRAGLTAPELSVRVVVSILLEFERRFGRARLEALWQRERIPLPLSYLKTLTNFVSVAFVEEVVDLLIAESGDPNLVQAAMRLTATPEAIGFIYYIFKALGSPRSLYLKLFELAPTYNRVADFKVLSSTDRSAEVRYVSRVSERKRYFCEGRKVQFAAIATIWGIQPARVTESQCQVDGADSCHYLIEWDAPIRSWRGLAGAALGLVLGAIAWRLGAQLPAVPLAALTGAMIGSLLDTRLELSRKDEALAAQNVGLVQSLSDLEKRYAEVHSANAALEQRVLERTSELSLANTQLADSLARQRELDQQKTLFFDNVSHELRTPVSLILLALESLTRGEATSPHEVRAGLDSISRSAERLLRLINQLLDLAKIEAGQMRLRFEEVDITALVESAMVPFQAAARQKGVHMTLEGHAGSLLQVDSERMDVMLQNLLSNALKFTPAGGRVEVSVQPRAGEVQLEIRDTGVGIPESDLGVIFDRFAQATSDGVKRLGGTGIGLALVREVVTLHGGSVAVESAPGQGSRFRVVLPTGSSHVTTSKVERRRDEPGAGGTRRRADKDVLSGLVVRPPSVGGPQVKVPAGSLAPDDRPLPQVLLVEDDPDLRKIIADGLRLQYRVSEACDGREALDLIRAEPPDLVITDLMMPRMSGLQLLQAIRAERALDKLPVLMLTARSEPLAVAEGLDSGASDYLAKPFSMAELRARVAVQVKLLEAGARSAASERLSALGLLTSGFAHEVRNPLNGLLNAIEPLRESMVEPGSAELLNVMEECARRVRSLAESLLTFGRAGTSAEAVAIRGSIESTVQVLRWRLPGAVDLILDLEYQGAVFAAPASLKQVWMNLLDNALRAVGDRGTIWIRTRLAGETVEVEVEDSGAGVPATHRRRLFSPFFSTRRGGEGMGLGLTLCRKILEEQGGSIVLSSGKGTGACFIVRVPAGGSRKTISLAPQPGRGEGKNGNHPV